jgi:hypothetical protein
MVDLLSPNPEQVFAYLQQVEPPSMRIAAGLASLARDDGFRQLLRMGLLADVAAIATDTSIRRHPLRLFSNTEIATHKRESSQPT